MNRSESDLARARLEGDRRTHCLTRRGWKEVSFSRLWPTALLLLPVLGTRASRNPRSTLQLVQPAKVESCAPSVSEEGEQRVVGAPRQLGGLPPPSHSTRGLTAYQDLLLLLAPPSLQRRPRTSLSNLLGTRLTIWHLQLLPQLSRAMTLTIPPLPLEIVESILDLVCPV